MIVKNVSQLNENNPENRLPSVDNVKASIRVKNINDRNIISLSVLHCKPPIIVRGFAQLLGIKPFRLISELMEVGIFASMNQVIEEGVALVIAEKYGFRLIIRHRGSVQLLHDKIHSKKGSTRVVKPKPPIVCILGHVDHGKTTLLDIIRKTNTANKEIGGITQHIGAYQVFHKNQLITFIDTPGHAAFSKMRERGANLTDIVVLVVAADDGFMPQTDQALSFARKANVPIIIAINKVDSEGANIDLVKQQMQKRSITSEDWGGEILTSNISALQGIGIDNLLDNIILQTEMLELECNHTCPAEGIIVESQVERGFGATASVILQKGILKIGLSLVCGSEYCKVRIMYNDQGVFVQKATPGTPVKIVGWTKTPHSGSPFIAVKDERTAKQLTEQYIHQQLLKSNTNDRKNKVKDARSLLAAIDRNQKPLLRIILKGDVNGTVEAIKNCLDDIQSNKINIDVVCSGVGLITKNDILTAQSTDAILLGFNIKKENSILNLAKQCSVSIIYHNIIYKLINQIKEIMSSRLKVEMHEKGIGVAEVRQLFKITQGGFVAGSFITEGKVLKDSFARLNRNSSLIYEGQISTLKRFKDDVGEVRAGSECGIRIDTYNNYKLHDVIEVFEVEKSQPSL